MNPDTTEKYFCYYKSPVGIISVSASDVGITQLFFAEDTKDSHENISPLLLQLQQELDLYFSGKLKSFSVPVDPSGTDFQKEVWKAITKIPYGKTTSYLQLSKSMKQPDAIRAIANANARNPVLIIIPCHRVIGTNGQLTGYAGGLQRKKLLLELEGSMIPSKQLSLF